MLAMLKSLVQCATPLLNVELSKTVGLPQKSSFSRLPMSCYKVMVEVGMEGDCSGSLGQQRALRNSHNGCP